MKKLLTLTLFVLMVGTSMMISSCEKKDDDQKQEDPPKKVWTIYIYGRPTCGFCNAFKQSLDDENIPYTFYNVDDEPDKNSEMWQKLNDAGMGGGSVGLPVVDVYVDGVSHIFIRPDRDKDVKPLISDG